MTKMCQLCSGTYEVHYYHDFTKLDEDTQISITKKINADLCINCLEAIIYGLDTEISITP